MVHHHQSTSIGGERRARGILIKSCDIYLVLILSSQALHSEICCLDGKLTPQKASNFTSTLTTNDSVASQEDIKKMLQLNTTTTTTNTSTQAHPYPSSTSVAARKTLTDMRQKIMRRRKDTNDMNRVPFSFPLVEDLTGGESYTSTGTTSAADGGGLLYGDDYLEDGLEFAETPPDPASFSSPTLVVTSNANGNPKETTNSTSISVITDLPTDIDIEQLVRSQVNMAATNFATLRPDEYQAPTFNDTIQGLDLSSYLSNFTNFNRQEPDHAIPEESASVKLKFKYSEDLFYPNHNYKYDQDTSNSPFKPSKLAELYKATTIAIDPMTASSDESNKYGSVPRAHTEHYVPATTDPLLRPADLQNYPNQVQHEQRPIMRANNQLRPSKTYQSDDKMNHTIGDQEQTQIDRPATVELAQGEQLQRGSSTNSSSTLGETNVHGSLLDQLSSKGFTDQQAARDYLSTNQLKSNVERLPYSRTGFRSIPPHLLYGMMNDKLQTIESLRVQPSSTPTSTRLKPNRKFRRPYKIPVGDQGKLFQHATTPNLSHLNINGSLAARLLVNRYKNWPLKSTNLTTTTTPKQIMLDPNIQKLLHAHYGLEVPPIVPISPLARLHSTTDTEAAKTFPWSPTTNTPATTNTRPTISLQAFAKSTTPLAMIGGGKTTTVTTPEPVLAPEVMLRSGSLKTNSTKPIGSRAYLRQAPAHHHHHHSHVHSIKPSLISIPFSLPTVSKYQHQSPSSNYYDSLLAAAAASAAAAQSHKLSRGHQVLAQSLLSQPHPGVAVRLPPKKHRHYPPGTIPIGGTLASTRGHPTAPITKTLHQHHQHHWKPTNSNNEVTTTYQSGLLAHLLETANRALKQVAGNTASLLNIQASNSHNQLVEPPTRAPPTSTTQRGSEFSASDYFEPIESQLHTIGLYQAPTDDSLPLSAYLAALLSSTSENLYSHPSSKLKDHLVEPLALASPSFLEWTDFGNQTSDSSEVMLASLGANSNLLYPIRTSSNSNSDSSHSLTKGALASLLDSDDQTENSNPVSVFDSPRHHYWSKPLLSPPPPGQRIIPLKQSNTGKNNNANKTLVATAQFGSKFMPNYQEEDLQNSSHHYPAPSAGKTSLQKNTGDSGGTMHNQEQQMAYAVTHYIGDSLPLVSRPKVASGTRGGENMVYRIVEPDYLHGTNSHHFHPMAYQHKRPIRGSSGLHKTGELVLASANSELNANPLDNLSDQPHIYSFSDHTYGTSPVIKTTLLGNDSKKSQSVSSLVGGSGAINSGEDYRANESKGEEHVVSIVPESSLDPNNKHPDPLELLMHLAGGGLKPHLMAVSDIVNYHKLKLIDHYLQHHVHGHEHMSEAARLAVGGHSHKAQLMLAFWPIIIAIIPIMIVVAIVVQLVLAAPLVLFAMTTLTVARFVSSVFGPMFSREDVSSSFNSVSKASSTSPRPRLAAVPSNNFLYSMLKMETKAPRYSKSTTTTSQPSTSPTPSTSTSTSGKPQPSRRRRRHVLSHREDHFITNELEDYFESWF